MARSDHEQNAPRSNEDEAVVAALLDAYRQGYFPMAEPAGKDRSDVRWFNPARRGILPLDAFHIPGTLRQRVRSGRFRVTSDEAFERVIRACAEPAGMPGREETWIDERIVAAYMALFRAGHAHSVEAWLEGKAGPRLVGGLYGVQIGGFFAGESMFCRPAEGGTDASKVCLVCLVGHLRQRGFTLLDTQFGNPHLERFGGVEIPRREYLERLKRAVKAPVSWAPSGARSAF